LYRISEFSILISRKETIKEVVESTGEFIKEIYRPVLIEIIIDEKNQIVWQCNGQRNWTEKVMEVPLIVNKKKAGLIRIAEKEGFKDIDRRILQLVSLVSSAAIEGIKHQLQIDRLKEDLMHLDRLSTAGTMVGAIRGHGT
ncbi:MAG: hypothetical protein GXO99_09395, partial [Nitrospirae bacterium]|nr:hypothetical protein [Nitrospirota bacterium]